MYHWKEQSVFLIPRTGKQRYNPRYHDAHYHTCGSEEEEVGIRTPVHPEYHSLASNETNQCSITLYLGHEDGNEEQAAQTAGEQTKDGIEIVQQRLNVPCSHKEGNHQT